MPPTPAVPRPPASTPTVGKARTGTTVDVELEPPTPSPFFPRDLTSLFCLNSDAARALVREYGLVEDDDVYENQSLDTDSGQGGGEVESSSSGVQQIPTPTSTTKDPDVDSDSREKNLTRFMVHIGVCTVIVRQQTMLY
jgi:hypothetical protein